ncbi:cupin [Fictibacillus nanhaiensis]|uniref:cupin n=1 Tax=Fictibacillus nanhaiensis TaxID=742169 RepID=UPI001C9487B3|nr:cupin [Fictibacillus nanhaiensis]MBY6037609.1 cupin [Fictibacillus nanhaiensis]
MKIFSFNKDTGKHVTKFNSNFVMSQIVQTQKPAHIGCMHLMEGGIIGYHQAVVPQLLLVVNGEGIVLGKDQVPFPIKAGEAVYWEKDEYHETTTKTGLTAIVIESEELHPASFKLKEINNIGTSS